MFWQHYFFHYLKFKFFLSLNASYIRVPYSDNIIRRYESDEVKPSIGMVAKFADVLKVSLDFLVGKIETGVEIQLFKKLLNVQQMGSVNKEPILHILHGLIKNIKLNSIA